MAKQKTRKPIRPITEENINDPATIEEFAAYLRLSYSTVYRMVRDGQLKASVSASSGVSTSPSRSRCSGTKVALMSNNTRAVVELSRGADPLEVAKSAVSTAATLCTPTFTAWGTFGLSMEREQALISAEDVDGGCILRIAAPDSGSELESAALTGLPTGSNS